MGYSWTGMLQRVDRTRGGRDVLVRWTSWQRTMELLKVELTADGYTTKSHRATQYGFSSSRVQQLEGGATPTADEKSKIRAYARTQGWRFP